MRLLEILSLLLVYSSIYLNRANGAITTTVATITTTGEPATITTMSTSSKNTTAITLGACTKTNGCINATLAIDSTAIGYNFPFYSIFIDLDNFGLKRVDKGAFTAYTSLITLLIRNNQLSESLPAGIFPVRIVILYLSQNQISRIDSDAFTDLVNLETLLLNNNSLTSLPANLFSATKIRVIGFWGNKISSVSEDAFNGLTNLNYVYLQDNLLTSITAATFLPCQKSIEYLDLSNNKFASLDVNLIQGMTALTTFIVSGNQLPTGFSFNTTGLNISLSITYQ